MNGLDAACPLKGSCVRGLVCEGAGAEKEEEGYREPV